MIESIAVGLILAAVSAVTFIAYKHPSTYRLAFAPAAIFISFSALVICAWQLGVVTSSASTIAALATHKNEAALQNIAESAVGLVKSLKWLGTTVGVYVLLFAYLLLLRRLRQLLPDEPPNSSSKRTR